MAKKFIELIMNDGSQGECSGNHIIEVDELPTENIDETALYLCKGVYYKCSTAALTDIIVAAYPMIISYKEILESNGASCNFHTVPTKPTEGIRDTTDSSFEFYYIQDEEDVFLHVDGEWRLFGEINGGNPEDFPGWNVIYDISEITGTTAEGYYLLFGNAQTSYHHVAGTLEVNENGTYDVRDKANVSVTVPTALIVQTVAELPSDVPMGSIAYVLEGIKND